MRRLVYIVLGFSLIGLAGCSNAKRIAEGKPLRPRDPGYIIKHSEKNALDWDWLAFKLDTCNYSVTATDDDGSCFYAEAIKIFHLMSRINIHFNKLKEHVSYVSSLRGIFSQRNKSV